jgi:hypothetical protein
MKNYDVSPGGVLVAKFEMHGRYDVDLYRKGKLIDRFVIHNDITNEGKNTIFDVMFNTATQIVNSSWFIGLISLTSFTALAATDVMASHGGWTEFTTYTQANRVAWGSVASSAQTVTNTTPAQFDMSASGTVKGIFITSNNTKSGTTGKLWSTALFAADVPVVNADQLKITYTLNA